MKYRVGGFSLAAGLLAVSVLVACAAESDENASAPETVTSAEAALDQGTGAEAFKGIFFGVGKYGGQLPRVWNRESAPFRARTDYVRGAERLVSVINSKSPQYFNAFARDIFSKDPVKVDAALDNAVLVLHSFIDALPSNAGQDIYKTENLVWKNDAVYETTRVVHGDPIDFEDPYTRRELAMVIVETWEAF